MSWSQDPFLISHTVVPLHRQARDETGLFAIISFPCFHYHQIWFIPPGFRSRKEYNKALYWTAKIYTTRTCFLCKLLFLLYCYCCKRRKWPLDSCLLYTKYYTSSLYKKVKPILPSIHMHIYITNHKLTKHANKPNIIISMLPNEHKISNTSCPRSHMERKSKTPRKTTNFQIPTMPISC